MVAGPLTRKPPARLLAGSTAMLREPPEPTVSEVACNGTELVLVSEPLVTATARLGPLWVRAPL